MLSDYLTAPSLNSLFVTGMLILLIVITIIRNFRELLKFGNKTLFVACKPKKRNKTEWE